MGEKVTYAVQGMTCGHCVGAVTDSLGALEGVSKVDVDLEHGRVDVTSDFALDEEAVRSAVEEAGFELIP